MKSTTATSHTHWPHAVLDHLRRSCNGPDESIFQTSTLAALLSGVYDGDMMAGKGFLQPDKAANFGAELVRLYKMTGNTDYLQAGVRIANTLAARRVLDRASRVRRLALASPTGSLTACSEARQPRQR